MCGSVGGINIADPLDFSGTQKRKDAKGAEARQAAAEVARQGRISGNVRDINSAFAGRQSQYDELGAALRERLNTALGRQRADATRQSKFALAKSGLTGGSAAIDAGRNLSRENQEGVLQVERQARGGVADLQAKDEQARTQLISLAQSGNDIGNAAAQTAAGLRANLEGAKSADLVNGLGDVFGATAKTYRAQQDAAARRRGLSEASTYTKAFSRG
jgi:hypothetical protein